MNTSSTLLRTALRFAVGNPRILEASSAGLHQLSASNCVLGAAQPQLSLPSLSGQRNFYSGLDTLPSRRSLFADLPLVNALLPNRKDIAAQFSPHGITLVPKSILAKSIVEHQQEEEEDEVLKDNAMMAIGIKKWRSLKMKKHKISKRRKLNRHKNKP